MLCNGSIITKGTREVLLSGVTLDVSVQIVLSCGPVVTDRAREWSISGVVGSVVLYHAVGRQGFVPAVLTRKELLLLARLNSRTVIGGEGNI